MLYIIETEDCGDTPAILKIINKYFDSYKIERGAIGYWKGKPELSLTIKIDTVNGHDVDTVAYAIKALNKQEAVLVYKFQVDSHLI